VTTSILDLRRFARTSDGNSFSNRQRSRRFEMFDALTAPLPRPLRILDVGGTNGFWEQRGWAGREDVQITTVNLASESKRHANIESRVGDATDLSEHADGSYDVVFSNSVIEHLFTFEAQAAMAREVQRVARAYWVQTPNYWFPVEPHFLTPGWQYMPRDLRVAIIRRQTRGWRGPCPDLDSARRAVDEIRLLRRRELRRLFPDAVLHAERFGGLVKSWVAYGGFPAPAA
jgi:hypothetical protein